MRLACNITVKLDLDVVPPELRETMLEDLIQWLCDAIIKHDSLMLTSSHKFNAEV